MLLKGDFHTHMNGNGIGNRLKNIHYICNTAINLGYNAVYLGCHDYVGSQYKHEAEDRYGLIVIQGAEVTTTAGHLLVYNIDNIPSDCWANDKNPLDIDKAITVFKGMGGKLVMAHPYENNRWAIDKHGFERVVDKLDGAEIRNYKSFLRDGISEFSWIKQWSHLKLFSSSDCHPWEGDTMVADYYTEIEDSWFYD